MISTGFVRHTDRLGRLSIPREVRELVGIECLDMVEITAHENTIELKKFRQFCVFCGSQHNIIEHNGVAVCGECAQQIIRCVDIKACNPSQTE